MSSEIKEKEMKEVVMDWLYNYQRIADAKRENVEKFIFFCKRCKENQMVSSKRFEKFLMKYEEWDDWKDIVRTTYLDYIL